MHYADLEYPPQWHTIEHVSGRDAFIRLTNIVLLLPVHTPGGDKLSAFSY